MRILISLLVVATIVAVGGGFVLSQRLEAEDLRLQLIQEAEAITGRDVSVAGRVDLSFLPQPTLSLAGATLGDLGAPGDAVRLTVDRVDLQVKPLPLLRGEVVVTAARLVRPVLHVDAPQDLAGLMRGDGDAAFLPLASLGVQRLSVIDGRAFLGAGAQENPVGSTVFERINMEVTANDRRGPFVVTADFYTGEHAFRLSGQIGRITTDPSTTLQLEIVAEEPSPNAARISYRGLVLTEDELRLRGRVVLAGDSGRGAIQAAAAALGYAPPGLPDWLGQPFEISGALNTVGAQAEVGELVVTVAGTEAQGRMALALGTRPVVDLTLGVPSLQLSDRLPVDWSALALAAEAAPWLDGNIDLTVGLLGYRGETVRRVRITMDLTGPDVVIEQVRAILPGNADVAFAGSVLADGGDVRLEGSLDAVTDDFGAVLHWLDLDAERLTLDHLRTLSFSSRLRLGPDTLRLHDVEARLDASTITGSLALDLDARHRVAAAVAVDRLDLDAYLPDAGPAEAVAAVRHWLAHTDAAIEADVERLTWQGLRWQEVHLDGRAVARRLSLGELSARGIAETRAELRGEVDFAAEQLDLGATLTADRPALLLRRLGLQPSFALARLGPTELTGRARGWRERTEVDLMLRSDDATATIAGQLAWPDQGPASYEIQVEAAHPDYAQLVHSLGAGWRQGELSSAPFELAGRLRGEAADQVTWVGTAGLGPTRVTGEVSWRDRAERPRLGARLSLGEPRADTLMPLLSLAGLRIDPGLLDQRVIGDWPAQPAAVGWLRQLDGTVELTGRGGLAGERLELRAALDGGRLMVERFATRLFGGGMELEASLDARGRLPYLAAAVTLKDVEAQRLTAWLGLAPVLEGRGDLYGEATAIGDNAHDLVRTLMGDLRLTVRDGRLLGLPLEEPASTEGGPAISVEPAGIAIELEAADPPPLEFDELDGRFEIKRGIAQASEASLRMDERTGRVEGLVDLLLWVADLRLVIEQQDSSEPAATVKVVGPLDRPQVLRLSPGGERDAAPTP